MLSTKISIVRHAAEQSIESFTGVEVAVTANRILPVVWCRWRRQVVGDWSSRKCWIRQYPTYQ